MTNTFPLQLRAVLAIHPSVNCHFERYSDSAGQFIVLDRNNTSVYKQLLRAAKAKQKLKMRVVLANPAPAAPEVVADQEIKTGPQPVTIEDVPEAPPRPAKKAIAPVIVPSASEERVAPQHPPIPSRFPVTVPASQSTWEQDVDAHLHATLQNMARNHELLERNIARLGASVAEMGRNADFSAPKTASPAPPPKVLATPKEALSTESDAPQPIPVFRPCPYSSLQATAAEAGSDSRSATACSAAFTSGFTVCCNSCERHIPDVHFHCSTCEEGDFDLCEDCVGLGITCYNPEHWMIRRYIHEGVIVNSTTERVPPKPKAPKAKSVVDSETTCSVSEKPATEPATQSPAQFVLPERLGRYVPGHPANIETAAAKFPLVDMLKPMVQFQIRTCNNCIRELPEPEFLHCTICYDFDLCKDCFAKNDHGHHPKHAFTPAVLGTKFDWEVSRRLAAGRGERHNAVCDGCEQFITGIRHKCLNCPDWDYCAECVLNADFIHPGHRFMPIFEPLPKSATGNIFSPVPAIHVGIYCDGPHCMTNGRHSSPILGDRYKCAVCHNTDFCANCEASPANNHNKTHPLIKFRTPVRHVSVTTTGEHNNGRRMPVMGDQRPSTTMSTSSETSVGDLQLNKVKTVVDVKPTTVVSAPKPVAAPEPATKPSDKTASEPAAEELGAMYQRDTIPDGTVFPPNHVFEQTWVLRNTGSVAWPAGCCIRFVSGDYMGHVDPNHPAGIQELVSASESTICYAPLAPGAEFPFTVLLRTPPRLGKVTSYWRLTTKGGIKFGDRLWCDVDVRPKEEEEEKEVIKEVIKEEKDISSASEKDAEAATSQMIFPKLEKQSPDASIHEPEPAVQDEVPVEEHSELDDWADDDSEDGFLTDEEYDILDASDEEFMVEEQTKSRK